MSKKKEKIIQEPPVEEIIQTPEVEPEQEIAEEEVIEIEEPAKPEKMVKIYMNTSAGIYNAHVRYRVCECVLKTLPEGSYVIIN
jgi:hypothetical protein